MSKAFPKISIVIIAFIASAFALGPRVDTNTTLKTTTLPQDLDHYLSESESQHTDIVANTEKHIQWAHTDKRPTDIAIVYLHGFSASRQEISPVSENLAKNLGANLYLTRLTGHGRGSAPMGEATVNHWVNDAVEAMAIGRKLGRKVVLIGTSTGGTLAAWAAIQQNDTAPDALILVSPNFKPAGAGAWMLSMPWGLEIAELIFGPERNFEPLNPLQAKYWTTRYPTSALPVMMGLVDLVEAADLSKITMPVLTLYSPNDGVVSAEATESALSKFGSKVNETIKILNSQDKNEHVIAGAIKSPNTTAVVTEAAQKFIESIFK